MTRALTRLLMALSVLLVPRAGLGGEFPSGYTVIELVPPPGCTETVVHGMNDEAPPRVVGAAKGKAGWTAVVWSFENLVPKPQRLEPLGPRAESVAWDINDAGRIVGDLLHNGRGAIWDGTGPPVQVTRLNATVHLRGVSRSGHVAGWSEASGERALLYVGGQIQPVDEARRFMAIGERYGYGLAVGARPLPGGGMHAAIHAAGSVVDLDAAAANVTSHANDVAVTRRLRPPKVKKKTVPGAILPPPMPVPAGGFPLDELEVIGNRYEGTVLVAGQATRRARTRAALWQGDGLFMPQVTRRMLGVLPGDGASEALGVNASRLVVGRSWGDLKTRAFGWSAGQGMIDLNDLATAFDGHLQRAEAVNRANMVICNGMTPAMEPRGFLLVPAQSSVTGYRIEADPVVALDSEAFCHRFEDITCRFSIVNPLGGAIDVELAYPLAEGLVWSDDPATPWERTDDGMLRRRVSVDGIEVAKCDLTLTVKALPGTSIGHDFQWRLADETAWHDGAGDQATYVMNRPPTVEIVQPGWCGTAQAAGPVDFSVRVTDPDGALQSVALRTAGGVSHVLGLSGDVFTQEVDGALPLDEPGFHLVTAVVEDYGLEVESHPVLVVVEYAGQPIYEITELKPTAGDGRSDARDINDRGDVAGRVTVDFTDGGRHLMGACRWMAGAWDTPDVAWPDWNWSHARSINDEGAVVGDHYYRTVFHWRDGEIVDVPIENGLGLSIADDGWILVKTMTGDYPDHFELQELGAFVLARKSGVTRAVIPFLAGDSGDGRAFLNEHGVVAGYEYESFAETGSVATLPFVAVPPVYEKAALPAVPFDDRVEVRGLNDRGDVIGAGNDAWAWWSAPTGGLAPDPLDESLEPHGINDARMVVGTSGTGDAKHAALWFCKQTLDLNYLIPADSGWKLIRASAINDRGQIVGLGRLNGKTRAFLLTPVSMGP